MHRAYFRFGIQVRKESGDLVAAASKSQSLWNDGGKKAECR
jgi:hypothetical protein